VPWPGYGESIVEKLHEDVAVNLVGMMTVLVSCLDQATLLDLEILTSDEVEINVG